MLFGPPGKATKLKKVVYLIASTVLGILLSFFAHGIIETTYLKKAQAQGEIVSFYNGCALRLELQIGLFIIGTVAGFLFGLFCWKKIYVERVRDKN